MIGLDLSEDLNMNIFSIQNLRSGWVYLKIINVSKPVICQLIKVVKTTDVCGKVDQLNNSLCVPKTKKNV